MQEGCGPNVSLVGMMWLQLGPRTNEILRMGLRWKNIIYLLLVVTYFDHTTDQLIVKINQTCFKHFFFNIKLFTFQLINLQTDIWIIFLLILCHRCPGLENATYISWQRASWRTHPTKGSRWSDPINRTTGRCRLSSRKEETLASTNARSTPNQRCRLHSGSTLSVSINIAFLRILYSPYSYALYMYRMCFKVMWQGQPQGQIHYLYLPGFI